MATYDGSYDNSPITRVALTDTTGQPIPSGSGGLDQEVVGNVAAGATDSGAPVKIGGVFNTTLPTYTNGQRGDLQLNNKGGLIIGGGTVASGATDAHNPVKVGGVYNTSAPVLTNGQRGDAQMDAGANLKMVEQYIPAYEDNTNGVAKVEQRFTPSYVLTADTLVKTGAGFIHSISFAPNDATPTAGSIIVYDNTAESGSQIFNWNVAATAFIPFAVVLNHTFATGLYVGFTTTNDVNVTVSYR